jgi:hypothetical protein
VAGAAPVVTITKPTENQDVSTKSDYTLEGTATDPGVGGSGIDRIQIFINGEREGQYASELGITTPGSDGSWSLTFKPTRYASTHSNVYV